MNNNATCFRTLTEIIGQVTDEYLDIIDMDDVPALEVIESELLNAVIDQVVIENQVRPKSVKIKVPQTLTKYQIAKVIAYIYPIRRVNCGSADSENHLLCIYQDSGENEGLYIEATETIKKAAQELNKASEGLNVDGVVSIVKSMVPVVDRTLDKNKIAVNNGIFNFESKELEPFDSKYVFLSKSAVNYNPAASNIVIHNDEDGTDWDVESWMESLSDDPEIVSLLWEIVAASVRPLNEWDKCILFYNEVGNNGKGTLCQLIRNLSGINSCISIPFSDFGNEYALNGLINKSLVVTDENDVGDFLAKAGKFKSVATGDVIRVNRKFKDHIDFRFRGLIIECINELPRVKDKSDSFYRRLLIVPFTKCFTGSERKYIKHDYLQRQEVLEYVLYKVIHMDFDKLSEPLACNQLLGEYKNYNDTIRQFLSEILEQTVWDLLPFVFLYDAYKAWFRKYYSSGILEGRNTFNNDVIRIISERSDWSCPGKTKSIHTGSLMSKPEHLIAEYGLDDWKNPTYMGPDLDLICMPKLKPNYYGIRRV